MSAPIQQVLLMPMASTYCLTAQTFLARTSGLDTTHRNAYADLICGLVSDGVWNKLDVLHVYATQDGTTALLNLVQNVYNGVLVGSATFTADRGYTMIGGQIGASHIDTQFNPATASSPNHIQNSAHISSWGLLNVSEVFLICGALSTTPVLTGNKPDQSGSAFFYANSTNSNATVAVSDSVGQYISNRTSSSQVIGYKNATAVVTDSSSTSGAPPNLNIYSAALNNNGVAEVSSNQIAAFSIGSSLSGTDVTNFYGRLRTYLTAVGVP